METNERIICAGVIFNDGKTHPHNPINVQRGYVIYGLRHHQCFAINSMITTKKMYSQQGFITDTNRFVNRSEAAKIAYEADQIKEEKDWLYSEDLY